MSASATTTPAMPSQPTTPELMGIPPLHMFHDDADDIRSDVDAAGDFSADSSDGSWMQSIVVEIPSAQGLQPRDGGAGSTTPLADPLPAAAQVQHGSPPLSNPFRALPPPRPNADSPVSCASDSEFEPSERRLLSIEPNWSVSTNHVASNRLGAGASGSVHALMMTSALGETVTHAVKVIRETGPERADAAAREVAYARRVKEMRDDATVAPAHSSNNDSDDSDSSRVVSVYRVRRDRAAGETTVTMELLPSTTAGDIAALQPVPAHAPTNALHAWVRERALRDVARDALRGLRHLHDTLRVAHRDIKPANLLLDHDGRVKIADFGMAAVLSRDGGDIATGATDQVGTLAYLSPERLRGEPHGAPGDVWALGVTLLKLALGGTHPLQWRPPADGSNERAPAADLNDFFQVAAAYGALNTAAGAFVEQRSTSPALKRSLDGAGVSADARDLLVAMLQPLPEARPTAAAALSHPWLA